MSNNTKKVAGLVVGMALAIGGVIWIGTGNKTTKVPCWIEKFDTTFETKSFCDTAKVFYDSVYYVTVRPNWRPYKQKRTKHTDSLKITNCRDSSVMMLIDASFMGECDSISKDTPMEFGLWIQGGDLKIPEKIEFLNSIGATIGRVDLVLSQYPGGVLPELELMDKAGLKSDIILSWNNKQGGLFVRDTVEFRRKLNIFLRDNHKFHFIITTEDEVATNNFFQDDFIYYINELAITIQECSKFNIQASNSGDHIIYALALANNERTNNENEQNVKYLLQKYKDVGLEFITLHNGSEQSPEDFEKAINYIRTISGIQVLAMNAHVFKGSDITAIKHMVALYKKHDFILFMPFDGNGQGKASSFHTQGELTKTPWAIELKEVINTK